MLPTLNSSTSMDHGNFLEPLLILIMRIGLAHTNYQATLNFYSKIRVHHIDCFPRKVMWIIILFCATCVLQLIFKVLVGSLHEDLQEDPGSWTYVNSTLTEKLVCRTLIISMLIFHPH